MEGAGLRLGFGPESSSGRLSTPTPEIRARSLRDRLAPPCSTQQLSFQWLRHANHPFIPCRVKFFQLFLDSSHNHVVIMLLDIQLACPPCFPAPLPTRLLGINSSPSTHPPPCPSSQFGARLFESQVCCPYSSLLRLFCFHALMNCKFHNPFLFTTIQNAGVCTPLALSCDCSFPRACVTFLLFDTLLLRRYYQFFSYGTRSLLAVPAADSHETRLF